MCSALCIVRGVCEGDRGGGAAVPVLVIKVGVPSTDESHGAQFRGDRADLPRSTPLKKENVDLWLDCMQRESESTPGLSLYSPESNLYGRAPC